jgi:hypothetical protein
MLPFLSTQFKLPYLYPNGYPTFTISTTTPPSLPVLFRLNPRLPYLSIQLLPYLYHYGYPTFTIITATPSSPQVLFYLNPRLHFLSKNNCYPTFTPMVTLPSPSSWPPHLHYQYYSTLIQGYPTSQPNCYPTFTTMVTLPVPSLSSQLLHPHYQ